MLTVSSSYLSLIAGKPHECSLSKEWAIWSKTTWYLNQTVVSEITKSLVYFSQENNIIYNGILFRKPIHTRWMIVMANVVCLCRNSFIPWL